MSLTQQCWKHTPAYLLCLEDLPEYLHVHDLISNCREEFEGDNQAYRELKIGMVTIGFLWHAETTASHTISLSVLPDITANNYLQILSYKLPIQSSPGQGCFPAQQDMRYHPISRQLLGNTALQIKLLPFSYQHCLDAEQEQQQQRLLINSSRTTDSSDRYPHKKERKAEKRQH